MSVFLQWLSVGALLILLELVVVPGTYLIWFGLSAVLMACITYFVVPSLMGQLVLFGIFSVIFAVIGWRVYGKVIFSGQIPQEYKNLNNPIAQTYGKIGVVTEVQDDKIQISIGDSAWKASSDEVLKVGEKVIITDSYDNAVLKVKKYLDKK